MSTRGLKSTAEMPIFAPVKGVPHHNNTSHGMWALWHLRLFTLKVVWGSARACGWSWSRVRSRVVGAGYTQASSSPKIGRVSDFQHPSGCEWPTWSTMAEVESGRATRREGARWVTGMDGRHPFWRSPRRRGQRISIAGVQQRKVLMPVKRLCSR